MIRVMVETEIQAPIEVCFDYARNIDLHSRTVWSFTREKAISGRTTGLIEEGETVTFEATHFLIRQRLTSKVTGYQRPKQFVDEMVSGAFKSMRHVHEFIEKMDRTVMRDTLIFEAPFGIIGWIAERMFLRAYMRRFLEYRNQELKKFIEQSAQ